MDFEPRESRLVTFGKRAAAVCAVLLFALVLYWRSPINSPFRSLFGRRTLSLPHKVSTLAEGYPFAVKLKDRIASDAQLQIASAFLNRKGDHFEIQMLNYYFVSKAGKGRTIFVGVLNERRQAYAGDMPGPRPEGLSSPEDLSVLALPPIDIPQLIQIAGTNGFNEFTKRTAKDCYASVSLMSTSNSGPFWMMTCFDLNDLQSRREFRLSIDARTGAVQRHSLR